MHLMYELIRVVCFIKSVKFYNSYIIEFHKSVYFSLSPDEEVIRSWI